MDILFELELMGRILLSAICGGIIGYERKNRLKEAGIRTHLIVALSSAVMMIISKYGFFDVLMQSDAIKLDPSRIAAGIVSGIGFLGAGMIFIRKQVINGLTTAAGIWATVGVGMAIGSGMYIIGVFSALAIIFFQLLLHKNLRLLKLPLAEMIVVRAEDSVETISIIKKLFTDNHITIINLLTEREEDGFMRMEVYSMLPKGFTHMDILRILQGCKSVKSVEM